MKNLFLKTMLILAVLFASCDKDESGEIIDGAVIDETINEESTLNDQELPEQKLLAKIQKNGHEFKFLEVVSEGSVLVIQKLNENAQSGDPLLDLLDDQSTPFNIFAKLTNSTVDVPKAIARTSENGELETSGRKITYSTTPIELLIPGFETISKAGCYDEGANKFRNLRCGLVFSTASDIRFCDNGTWISHKRNSVFGGQWRLLDDTTTWTNVICGLTKMQFLGNNALEAQVDLPNGIWKINYYTSTNKKRSVKRFRTNNTGSFRAYTRFF